MAKVYLSEAAHTNTENDRVTATSLPIGSLSSLSVIGARLSRISTASHQTINKPSANPENPAPFDFKFYGHWALLSGISFALGLTQTIPLAIIVPESLELGLSTSEATCILAAWSVSSILTLILQVDAPTRSFLIPFFYSFI